MDSRERRILYYLLLEKRAFRRGFGHLRFQVGTSRDAHLEHPHGPCRCAVKWVVKWVVRWVVTFLYAALQCQCDRGSREMTYGRRGNRERESSQEFMRERVDIFSKVVMRDLIVSSSVSR